MMKTADELLIKQLPVGQLATNCYIIADSKTREAVIVDPGDDAQYISGTLRDLQLEPQKVVATHGHFDHILAAFELQYAYKIPFFVHSRDEFLVTRMRETAHFFLQRDVIELPPHIDGNLEELRQLRVGHYELSIIETPGHTPGSICFFNQELTIMFTGDTIFAGGSVGRTDFSYSSIEELQNSVRIILDYPPDTVLYPGHGVETTILQERKLYQLKNVQ